jgi:hypothetical protein
MADLDLGLHRASSPHPERSDGVDEKPADYPGRASRGSAPLTPHPNAVSGHVMGPPSAN